MVPRITRLEIDLCLLQRELNLLKSPIKASCVASSCLLFTLYAFYTIKYITVTGDRSGRFGYLAHHRRLYSEAFHAICEWFFVLVIVSIFDIYKFLYKSIDCNKLTVDIPMDLFACNLVFFPSIYSQFR